MGIAPPPFNKKESKIRDRGEERSMKAYEEEIEIYEIEKGKKREGK